MLLRPWFRFRTGQRRKTEVDPIGTRKQSCRTMADPTFGTYPNAFFCRHVQEGDLRSAPAREKDPRQRCPARSVDIRQCVDRMDSTAARRPGSPRTSQQFVHDVDRRGPCRQQCRHPAAEQSAQLANAANGGWLACLSSCGPVVMSGLRRLGEARVLRRLCP
jgi:hypothetical protein